MPVLMTLLVVVMYSWFAQEDSISLLAGNVLLQSHSIASQLFLGVIQLLLTALVIAAIAFLVAGLLIMLNAFWNR